MNKISLLGISALWLLSANAGVNVESGCYVRTPEGLGKNTQFFLIQSYYDDELQGYVGAFVDYNNSKNRISLVFADEVQGDGVATGDYQRYWLEIENKKVTGQYVEYGTYSGNAGGNYIKYTNSKQKKVTLFRIATIDSPCIAGR